MKGWRVVLSGGNLNNGANAGVAYFNANNASSNVNTNIGSHLCLSRKNIGTIFSDPASWQNTQL